MRSSPASDVEFRAMYNSCASSIHRYCYRRLPPGEVDDATAEVFLVAWRRFADVPSGDETILWLYGVARNVVRNIQRSQRRRLRLFAKLNTATSQLADETEIQVIRRVEDQQVVDALASLRPRDQELLRLAAWEGLNPAEIGHILGIAPHAASMRLRRARDRLALKLDMQSERQVLTASPRPTSKEGTR